jgi:hypothetical protein
MLGKRLHDKFDSLKDALDCAQHVWNCASVPSDLESVEQQLREIVCATEPSQLTESSLEPLKKLCPRHEEHSYNMANVIGERARTQLALILQQSCDVLKQREAETLLSNQGFRWALNPEVYKSLPSSGNDNGHVSAGWVGKWPPCTMSPLQFESVDDDASHFGASSMSSSCRTILTQNVRIVDDALPASLFDDLQVVHLFV